jgi:hypothetical protein
VHLGVGDLLLFVQAVQLQGDLTLVADAELACNWRVFSLEDFGQELLLPGGFLEDSEERREAGNGKADGGKAPATGKAPAKAPVAPQKPASPSNGDEWLDDIVPLLSVNQAFAERFGKARLLAYLEKWIKG